MEYKSAPMRRMVVLCWIATAVVSVAAGRAQAQDVFGGSEGPPRRDGLRWNADAPVDADPGTRADETAVRHGEQRPFVFARDPSILLPGEVSIEYALQGVSGTEALRPLPANLGARGALHGATVGIGATSWLAAFATGLVYQPADGSSQQAAATGQAGLRLLLTRPDAALRAGAETSFVRELAGAMGVASRLSLTYDAGPLRMVGNAYAEKIFTAGRDSVDLLAFGGASVRATSQLRVGAEYVGQDLEDAFESEEAEGGARHFAGPVAAFHLADGSFWVTAGPAFGLNERSPRLIGRLSVAAAF
jgi:hypothetical protein